ncbi:MAG: hypothetical protein ACRC17_07920 [Culicoidibacterales bacterium]
MVSKKQAIVLAGVFIVIIGIIATMLVNQDSNKNPSIPRVIETPEIFIEVVQIKQLANVVTVQLMIENREKTELVLNNEQLLISIEPYYQDHVHEATFVKTLDYSGGNTIPAETTREVIVEFDINHEITTDYYMLYSEQRDFETEQLFYSLTLS